MVRARERALDAGEEAQEERVDLERLDRAREQQADRARRARLSARAGALGLQPSSAAASRILARVPSPTPRRPFIANETAADETPALRATSSMVGRRRAGLPPAVIAHP